MFYKLNLNLFIFILITLLIPLYAFDIELTILVPANQRECFHQILDTGRTIEVEYEVLAGGDFDINYWFYSPTQRILQSDLKKRDGHQTLKLEETGEYRFCLDNTFSRFSSKQVYFSLRPIDEQGQNEQNLSTEDWMNSIDKDELGDLQSKLQDIKVRMINFSNTLIYRLGILVDRKEPYDFNTLIIIDKLSLEYFIDKHTERKIDFYRYVIINGDHF
jgi:protein ERP2